MSNKYNSGRPNPLNFTTSDNDLDIGEVVNNVDPEGMGRIQVRVKGPVGKGGNDSIATEDLEYVFPLIPKHFSLTPKVGEAVLLISLDKTKKHINRLYVGPIISQPQRLSYDPFHFSSLAGFDFGFQGPAHALDGIDNVRGVFPNPEDVSVQGRDNAHITLKNGEVLLRAGMFIKDTTRPQGGTPKADNSDNPFDFSFNRESQGYIQIKYDVLLKTPVNNETEERGTVTNIVANKINLITHAGGSPRFVLNNQDNLISNEEMLKILADAHQLPFGDVLIEYLRLFKDAFISHVHNGSGNPSTDLTGAGKKLAVDTFKKKADDLENKMLSKNIRIN